MVGQDGQEYFIAEPYDLEARTIENLQEFCREFDLDFHISATSYHFPTQTLRITVWPKGETKRRSSYRRLVFRRRVRCDNCQGGWRRTTADGKLIACATCGSPATDGAWT